jgi:hypothetical protein
VAAAAAGAQPIILAKAGAAVGSFELLAQAGLKILEPSRDFGAGRGEGQHVILAN